MSENFFKVPIERLLGKIVVGEHQGIQFNDSQWAMVSGLSENRFWVHISARRTGKSLSASILAFANPIYMTSSTHNSLLWSKFGHNLTLETQTPTQIKYREGTGLSHNKTANQLHITCDNIGGGKWENQNAEDSDDEEPEYSIIGFVFFSASDKIFEI